MNQAAVFALLTKGARFNKDKESIPKFSAEQASAVEKWREVRQGEAEDEQEREAEDETEDHDDARRFFHIKVKGADAPGLVLNFANLEMADPRLPLLENIEESRYKEPTPVQMQAIPTILAKRDMIAIAPTGSGKTAAYLIPRLASLTLKESEKTKRSGVHTLVVVPTHELADQVVREHDRLSEKYPRHLRRACTLTKSTKEAVCEALQGESFYCLVTATPLLLIEALDKVKTRAQVDCVVFDEADRLFESTFVEQTDSVLAKLREENQQRLMLSATMPSRVERLASTILRESVKIVIGKAGLSGASTIEQKLIYAGFEEGKMVAFRNLLREGTLAPPCLVFVDSKDRAREVFRALSQEGVRVDVMHGERSPAQRDQLVKDFREGKLWFLVATELLARGVDFRGTNTVINWDMPSTPVSYIHRIGRCGRAGRRGVSVTFFVDEDVEENKVRSVANVVKNSGFDVPEWILQRKVAKRKQPKEEKTTVGRTSSGKDVKFDKKNVKRARHGSSKRPGSKE